MTHFIFPDNTVLVNFTLLGRHDLVEWVVRDRGMWALSVARECGSSAKQPGLSGMADWRTLFGDPLVPSKVELVDAGCIAASMRKPGEYGAARHMGEAETIAIVTRRRLEAFFLTDDFDAFRVATRHGLAARSTQWVIGMAEAGGRVDAATAEGLLNQLADKGRVLGPLPGYQRYEDFVRKLKAFA